MANEKRVRQNFIGGLVDTADLASGGTTLNSAGLAGIATTIDTTNHLPITLDPDGIYGAPEVVYITAYTLGGTSATILRGQEGTTARQHLLDTPWVHGPTVADFNGDLAWTAATLLNSYTSGGGGSWPAPGYRRLGNGLVIMRGLVNMVGTTSSAMFQLPVGYRPSFYQQFTCMGDGGGTQVAGSATVRSTGDVMQTGLRPATDMDLSNISFLAEA